MSVTSCNRLQDGKRGPTLDAEGNRSYVEVFEVITDSSMTGLEVLAYNGLPRLYLSSHPDDVLARCNGINDPEQLDTYYWRVPASYSTKLPMLAQASHDGSGQQSPSVDLDNPLNQPPEIEFETKYYKVLRETDFDNKPLRNSSWEPYPSEQIEEGRLALRFARNLAAFDVQQLKKCNGAVNKLTYLGFDPRFLKMEDLKARRRYEKNRFFWTVSGLIVAANSSEDWYTKKLDAGFTRWEDPTGGAMPEFEEAVPIYVRGQRPARPVPLNGNGDVLAEGAALHYNVFRFVREEDFNLLNLFT